jgi:nucleoside-diphosphate-sugar epimerase
MSCLIINELKEIENCTYLELGVFKNYNFRAINCKEKFSVDIVPDRAMFTGTTDEYFSQLPSETKFDIVFIDANHDYDYVLRDFNNAVDHCNKWILIHDMIPPNEEQAQSHFCSDSYKLLTYLLKETNFEVYPMNENFGLTLIKIPATKVYPSDDYKNISYGEFIDFIKDKKLYSNEEIIEILNPKETNMNKILILGGAGYIGGAIANLLQNNVAVLDNLLYEDRYLRNVDFFNIDVRNIEEVSKVVNNYDTVIVLAGLVGDAACAVDPNMTRDINITHVKWLADNYKGKIVYTSTCSVYGKNDDLIDETATPNPLSVYAETKLEAEQYLINARPDTLIFRLGTLYGVSDSYSRPRLDLVVNVLTMRAALGETLKVFGGEQWRPLLHVKDVAEAMIYGLENNLSGIYNLSERNVILKDIAEEILKLVPGATVEYNELPFEDQRNYKVKNDKILATGWKPKYILADGIKEIYDLFKTHRLKDHTDLIYHNGNYLGKIYGTKNN